MEMKIRHTLYVRCSLCKGKGNVEDEPCEKCKGTGKILKLYTGERVFKKTLLNK